MLDSNEIKRLAGKHENLLLIIKNLDKDEINFTIEGTFGTFGVTIQNKTETELKTLNTIANALKELAVHYERKIQDIVRKTDRH